MVISSDEVLNQIRLVAGIASSNVLPRLPNGLVDLSFVGNVFGIVFELDDDMIVGTVLGIHVGIALGSIGGVS